MSLPPEVRANYINFIDTILTESDLSRISEKKIRQGIQAKVEYDITPQKAAIRSLILERFDIFNAQQQQQEQQQQQREHQEQQDQEQQEQQEGKHTEQGTPSTTVANGYHNPPPPSPTKIKSPTKRVAPSEDVVEVMGASPRKKKKRGESSVDADAALAARLQAEEDKRARPTRGGASRKATPVKKKTPKKTAPRIRGSDDSDVEDSLTQTKPKNTGFNKPMNLSPALSEFLQGETALSRPQCVKRIWQYIRAKDLQDPGDRRNIICDDAMRKVFKQDKIHMFTMNKVLHQNLYPIDE